MSDGNQIRIICYADILGFRQKISKRSISEKMNVYKRLVNGYKSAVKTYVRRGDRKNNIRPIVIKHSNITWFSDSIILYSKELNRSNNAKEIKSLIDSAINIFNNLLVEGFPVRGAIEIDSFYADEEENIYVGQGLISAYELAESCDWAGIVLTEKATLYINEKLCEERFMDDLFECFIEEGYKVPLKNGEVKEYDVLNWTIYDAEISENTISDSFKYRSSIKKWDVYRKLQNTINFFKIANGR